MGRYGGYIGPSPNPKKALLSHLNLPWLETRSSRRPLLFTAQSGRVSRSLLTNVFVSNPLSHCKLCSGRFCKQLHTNTQITDHRAHRVIFSVAQVAVIEPVSCFDRRPQITWWPPIHLLTDPFVYQPTQSPNHLFRPPTEMFWFIKCFLDIFLFFAQRQLFFFQTSQVFIVKIYKCAWRYSI